MTQLRGWSDLFAEISLPRAAWRRRTITSLMRLNSSWLRVKIFFAVLPKHYAGKTNGGAGLGCSRIKLPEVRREKPGPPQWFTGGDGIDNDRLPIASRRSISGSGPLISQMFHSRPDAVFMASLNLTRAAWRRRIITSLIRLNSS
jgi:hypothetical protein